MPESPTADRLIRYDYGPVPTVREFSRSNAFIRGLMGPFGSGKSSGCVIEILRRAQAQAPGPDGVRRTRFAVIRNTYGQLKDTSMKTLFQWLPKSLGAYLATDHIFTITNIPGMHIEILFRALDRHDQVDNLLSLELTGAWVNEAREIPWAIIQALQGRVGRYPAKVDGGPSWFGLWMDTNPPDDDSWWYDLFELRRVGSEASVQMFRQPSGLAPNAENLINLPPGYYQGLMETMDPETAKVYVEGEYGMPRDGKPVYPEYRDTTHCREIGHNKIWRTIRGWDFGLTPACLIAQVSPAGQLRFLDEIVSDRSGIDAFGDIVKKHCADQWGDIVEWEDVGDPAGGAASQTDEKTCFQILRAKGIDIEAGEQSPSLRQGAVKRGLTTMIDGEPGLLVHPRCQRLRKGFQGRYRYRRVQVSGDERYHSIPDKNIYSHPHDAAQYLAAQVLGGLIKHGPSIERKRNLSDYMPTGTYGL